MQTLRRAFLVTFALAFSFVVVAQPAPPATEKKPHVTKIHGDTLVDNYFWLREKSNPDVIAHLEAEKIERVDTVMWAPDNKAIVYVTQDKVTKRSDRFFRHVLGTPAYDLVYKDDDELNDISAYRTRDKAFIIVGTSSKTTSEIRYFPADKPGAPLRVIAPRKTDHRYFVDHRGNRFYIRTNDHAKNYRLVTAPDTAPEMK